MIKSLLSISFFLLIANTVFCQEHTLISKSGTRYEGTITRGTQESGYGVFIVKTHDSQDGKDRFGNKYEGGFKADKFHGYGTLNGAGEWARIKYVGEWKDGNHNGYGTFTFRSGNKYAGIWQEGELIDKMSLHSVEAYLKNKYPPGLSMAIDHSKSSEYNSLEAEERVLKDASVRANNNVSKNSGLKLKGKCPSINILRIQHTYSGPKYGTPTQHEIYEHERSEIDLGYNDLFDSDDNNKIRIKWDPIKPKGVEYKISLTEEGGVEKHIITENTEHVLEGLNRGSKYHIKVVCDCGKKGGSQAFEISVITP